MYVTCSLILVVNQSMFFYVVKRTCSQFGLTHVTDKNDKKWKKIKAKPSFNCIKQHLQLNGTPGVPEHPTARFYLRQCALISVSYTEEVIKLEIHVDRLRI